MIVSESGGSGISMSTHVVTAGVRTARRMYQFVQISARYIDGNISGSHTNLEFGSVPRSPILAVVRLCSG